MPEPRHVGCVKCGRESPSWLLVTCPICGTGVCTRCAAFVYGRNFCSRRCADFYVHGEGEQEDEREDEA